MKTWSVLTLFAVLVLLLNCTSKKDQPLFYVDQEWIEVHINKKMSTSDLVNIRERLVPLGVLVKYLIIQRDSVNNEIIQLQIEVQDGKGKVARSRTEFLDEIPYGIRIHRNDYSDEGFKIGPLYTKRPGSK